MIKRYYEALDPGGTSGTPAKYGTSTSTSGNPSYYQETQNISGAAGAVVVVQTYIVNSNDAGQVLVNSSQVFNNNTFSFTLDGSGNASYVVRLQGDAGNTGTGILAKFTIVSVTIGQIGNPSSIQISKAF
ncbi:MAG TPA: hypothetical protein VN722_08480 [Hanamia sp.]|nr:hypothetical protein [Hanamia sp.]